MYKVWQKFKGCIKLIKKLIKKKIGNVDDKILKSRDDLQDI